MQIKRKNGKFQINDAGRYLNFLSLQEAQNYVASKGVAPSAKVQVLTEDAELAEALSKDADAGKWIEDFINSENPKFVGKSKEERKKMALAAYYAKQNESVEETGEAKGHDDEEADEKLIKKMVKKDALKEESSDIDALKQHLEHAGYDHSEGTIHHAIKVGNKIHFAAHDPESGHFTATFHVRGKGGDFGAHTGEAVHKSKEEAIEHVKKQAALKEETIEEQLIAEVSKKTLGSYIKKAAQSGVNSGAGIEKANQINAKVKQYTNTNDLPYDVKNDIEDKVSKVAGAQYDKHMKTAKNRMKGIARATARLTKEDVEITEEILDMMESLDEEQLNELGKDNLTQYAVKAKRNIEMLKRNQNMPASSDIEKKLINKEMDKRQSGLSAAQKRLTKEDTDTFKSYEYEITESYQSLLQSTLSLAGYANLAEASDEEKGLMIKQLEEAFDAKDFSIVLEDYVRQDVEDSIDAHKKAGHKVSDPKYTKKDGKMYAQYTLTTPEGDKKTITYHGAKKRMENIAENEQLDEESNVFLQRAVDYHTKEAKRHAEKAQDMKKPAEKRAAHMEANKLHNNAYAHFLGASRAVDKETRESHENKGYEYADAAEEHERKHNLMENIAEDEQLDELSDVAKSQAAKYNREADHYENEAKKHPVGSKEHHENMGLSYNALAIYHKELGNEGAEERNNSLAKEHFNKVKEGAVSRLVKEEEQLEEAISDEHMEAIKSYADKHGKDWKQKLSTAWMKGTDSSEPNGHLLRQVRNQHGPSVLSKLKI